MEIKIRGEKIKITEAEISRKSFIKVTSRLFI